VRSLLKHKLDYSDYLAAPEDGKRYEILQGELYVTACPTPRHQRVSHRLQRCLEDYFHERSHAEVFDAPLAVIFTNEDIAEPDLLVVDDSNLVSERGIEGPPLLVVEILSPSTRSRDQGVKARRYAELAVRHYWMVDPDNQRVECLRLECGSYQRVAQASGDDSLTHPDWEGLAVDLLELWR
jgi:Uma2 family endonuclease